MTNLFRRTLHAALLLTLVLMAGLPTYQTRTSFAQDDTSNEVVIAGSRYVQDLLQKLVDNYNTAAENDTTVQFDAQGNADGFTRLCGGVVDGVMATEAISDEQLLVCDTNAIEFVEVVLAYEALVLVPSAGAPAACIDQSSLPSVLGEGGAAQLNWSVVNPTATPGDITLYGPNPESQTVVGFLASLLPDAPRTDYTQYESPQAAVDILKDPASAGLAFMTFNEWSKLEDQGGLTPLQASTDQLVTCLSPDDGTIAAGTYPFRRQLMLYVNVNAFDKANFVEFAKYAVGTDGLPVADDELNFTAPVQAVLDRGLNNINGPIVGRTFTRPNSPVTLNSAAEGSVTVSGTGLASTATKPIFNSFTATYANVDLTIGAMTNDQSWGAFCSGTASVIQVNRPPTEAELATCAENKVDPYTINFGSQAVVLVVKADSDLPVCMDYSQLSAMLVQNVINPQAGILNSDATAEATEVATEAAPTEVPTEVVTEEPTSEPTEVATEVPSDVTPEATEAPIVPLDPAKLQGPARWNEINPEWPDRQLLVLAPSLGALETDLILAAVTGGQQVLRRTDAPIVQMSPVNTPNASGATDIPDLQYRIGATANFDGAITYTLWTAFQADPGKDGVRVIQIDAGSGCIEATTETILDGSYPLSYSTMLVFSKSALSDDVVAALLWQTFDGDALAQVEALGLVGFDRAALESERENIFTLIEEARRASADANATPEATEEPTETPTETPTEIPTEVPTEIATEVATEMPTEVPTEVPTEAPTAQPTEAATQAAQ